MAGQDAQEALTLRVGGEYLSPCQRDRVNDDLDWDLAVAPAPQMRPHRSILFEFRLRASGDPSDNDFGEMFAQ
jgi:hypothetical protein